MDMERGDGSLEDSRFSLENDPKEKEAWFGEKKDLIIFDGPPFFRNII